MTTGFSSVFSSWPSETISLIYVHFWFDLFENEIIEYDNDLMFDYLVKYQGLANKD